jgi:endonuclease YncB( thermonuclease family)
VPLGKDPYVWRIPFEGGLSNWEKALEREYSEWRAKQIELGVIPKVVPPYDPEKKKIPFHPEAGRKRYGPLSQLEPERSRLRAAAIAGEPVDIKRVAEIGPEVSRLRKQEQDIAQSLFMEQQERRFVAESYGWTKPSAQAAGEEYGEAWARESAKRAWHEEAPRLREVAVQGADIEEDIARRARANPYIQDAPPGKFKRLLTKRNALIAGGVFGIYGAARLLASKENHNTIEGLHPGSFGIGAEMIRSHSEFGSGYQGLPSSLMGQQINPEILAFREEVMDVPKERRALKQQLRAAQESVELGTLRKGDVGKLKRAARALNLNNRNLREVDLDEFNLKVEDADTLLLERKGLSGWFSDPVQVRLTAIDAPEVSGHMGDPLESVRINQEQLYGKEATKQLKRLIEQQDDLSLVIDPSQKTYGRYLGALVGDKSILNLELIKQGAVAALPWGDKSKEIISRESAAAYERQAREQERGMWGFARYKAVAAAEQRIGQNITANTLTRIDKLAQNLNLGALQSFLEELGDDRRELTQQEFHKAQRMGYALSKTHGVRRNRKFYQLSENSVGVGLRSANNAGRGHRNYRSTHG